MATVVPMEWVVPIPCVILVPQVGRPGVDPSPAMYSKSYFVEVAYRDASTGWQWMKQQVIRSMESQQAIRSMESHPRTHPKRAKTVSADAKRAKELAAEIDIHIADELGQTPKEYLHQSVLPISATKKHHLTPTSSTNTSPASMPTK